MSDFKVGDLVRWGNNLTELAIVEGVSTQGLYLRALEEDSVLPPMSSHRRDCVKIKLSGLERIMYGVPDE